MHLESSCNAMGIKLNEQKINESQNILQMICLYFDEQQSWAKIKFERDLIDGRNGSKKSLNKGKRIYTGLTKKCQMI